MLLAFVIPGVFIGLELLFGLVQALVFALLAMTYITLAIAEHRQHGDADHHSGRGARARHRLGARGGISNRKEEDNSWTCTHSQPDWPWGSAASARGSASASASEGDGGDRPQP